MINRSSLDRLAKAEKAVIGAVLQKPDLAADLRPDWFYDLRLRRIAEAIIGMDAARKPVDISTTIEVLDAGGLQQAIALVTECDKACHSPANFPYWRDQLIEAATLRAIVTTANNAICSVENRNDETPADILDAYEREVLDIRKSQYNEGDGAPVAIKQTLCELIAEYEQAMREGKPPGLATGYCALDKVVCGLREQQMIVVAARPSVGKTALALSIAERKALDDQIPVAFFSLEMSGKELLNRLTCSRAHVDSDILSHGKPTADEIEKITVAQRDIAHAPLYIVDQGGLSLTQLSAYARRLKQKHGIRLLIVDYLGLVRSGVRGISRYEETTLVSNSVKALAKELRLPVIVLCQLNRDNDREGRIPRLSDLRDSGAIEQDADVVLLLHRDDKQTGDEQTISVIVAKQRNGRTGKVDLLFRRQLTRFDNKP